MMEDNSQTIYCSRCGALMNSKARCCLKCGNLNYDNEANKNMRPYIDNQDSKAYEVGSGNYLINTDGKTNITLVGNTGNELLCFLFTYLLYIFLVGIIGFVFFKELNYDVISLTASIFPVIVIVLSIIFIYIYSLELLYIKCNKKWWFSLIPIYNIMELSDVVFKNRLLGLIGFIPFVGPIFMLIIMYKLGKAFSYNGYLVAIFSFIYLPIIAFRNNTYLGYTFVSQEGSISLEKRYRYKKIFIITSILVSIFGIGSIIYSHQDTIKDYKAENYYYVLASNKMLAHTKKIIKSGEIKCSEEYQADRGIYYVIYPDVGKVVHLPFYYLREAITGYVKIDNTSGKNEYFVSLTDKKLGFHEVSEAGITKDIVNSYTDDDYENLNVKCSAN